MKISAAKIVFALLFLSLVASGQTIRRGLRFTHVKENSQLSNPIITDIWQDKKGWMWIGTLDGLNRFDGYEFKIYRNREGDTTSLFKNYIQRVFEDSRGTLWVATLNSGLHYYDRGKDAFVRIQEYSRDNCQVLDIIEDSEHNLWISGVIDNVSFVAVRSNEDGKWSTYPIKKAIGGIYAMCQEARDELWLGTRLSGLLRWNKSTGAVVQYKNNPDDPESIPGDYVEDVLKDKQGNIWVGTRHSGLARYRRDRDNFKRFTASTTGSGTIARNDIMDMCLERQFLWLAIENGGLARINTASEEIENIDYNQDDPRSIINNSIWSIHVDKAARLWVGSYGKGLCVLDPHEKNFFKMKLDLGNDLVNAVFSDSHGRLWIGGEDGVIMVDKGKPTHFKHTPGDPRSLSADAVQSIVEDKDNQIWIGTWSGGVNRYVEGTRSFVRYVPDPNKAGALLDPNVFSVHLAKKSGTLLVCTFGGLHVLKDSEHGIFESILDNPREGDQLLLTSCQDSEGNVWVGGLNGFYLYDLEKKKVRKIALGEDPDQVGDRVNHIIEDSKFRLWVATSAGLFERTGKEQFRRYSVADGLPVNAINAIQEDFNGNLWLATTHGLVFFDPDTKQMRTFITEDGLNSKNIRERAVAIDKDGFIYLGSNGVNVFHPDSIYANKSIPPVYFTDLKILNRSITPGDNTGILTNSISETNEINLAYDHGIISIHYVALNFTASEKNQYAYKLEPFDKEWVNAGELRFATYTNLDPGTYTFRVKASNNDGLWNETGASLVVHILPPWWETWWFRSLAIVAVISAFFLFYFIRTRNIRRINRVQEEIISRRTKQLQETNNALVKREEKIEQQNKQLQELAEELSAQNEELLHSQEEIKTQRDLVYMQNQRLIETQYQIELQNENLEVEVAKRTKELVEYNRQLEQFAFISAHNLRSPVARIIGLGNLLSRPESDPQEKEQIYPKIVHAASELDVVIKDLNTILDLKKNNELFVTEVFLEEEVMLIKENLEHEISNSNATITSDFSSLSVIRTVKPYIDSILYNLISNAIKYRHPDRPPKVHLETAVNQTEFSIIVKDNGLGIDTSLFKEKLFTFYSRFHSHVEGKGMGLYLVKTQVMALGGRIDVESKVDVGTTFTMHFKIPHGA